MPDDLWNEARGHDDEQAPAGLVMAIAGVDLWNRLDVATRQGAGREW